MIQVEQHNSLQTNQPCGQSPPVASPGGVAVFAPPKQAYPGAHSPDPNMDTLPALHQWPPAQSSHDDELGRLRIDTTFGGDLGVCYNAFTLPRHAWVQRKHISAFTRTHTHTHTHTPFECSEFAGGARLFALRTLQTVVTFGAWAVQVGGSAAFAEKSLWAGVTLVLRAQAARERVLAHGARVVGGFLRTCGTVMSGRTDTTAHQCVFCCGA